MPLRLNANTVRKLPWFGLDIGSTLTKLVLFEPKDKIETDQKLMHMHRYLINESTYGNWGQCDTRLQMNEVRLNQRCGSLHFIHFQTQHLNDFLYQFVQQDFCDLMDTIGATGGGAHKFAEEIYDQFNIKIVQFDELDTLIKGILFAEHYNCAECYYFNCHKKGPHTVEQNTITFRQPYPFLLVNIGSGVSILTVRAPDDFKRVSGSSLGGGTFLGLCCLLTGCSTFKEAIELATEGNHRKVDKLVRDIYGGDYARFGLDGELIASSFGHMHVQDKRAAATPADLARATLVTIATNIGEIAHLCAVNECVICSVFVGNFLRINPIAMKLLADAMDYWSNGSMKAVFLQHEGYFGALGCLLKYHVKDLDISLRHNGTT